jgi:hypothetical protein
MARQRPELAQIVRRFATPLIEKRSLSPQQTKAFYNILQCRTVAMGGHEEQCDHCGSPRWIFQIFL